MKPTWVAQRLRAFRHLTPQLLFVLPEDLMFVSLLVCLFACFLFPFLCFVFVIVKQVYNTCKVTERLTGRRGGWGCGRGGGGGTFVCNE